MIFGITTTTHQKRQEYFEQLLEQVKILGYKTIISTDDGTLGIYNNKKTCWMNSLEKAIAENDACILAEDDILLSKNFDNYLKQLDSELMFYCLFNRLRNGKTIKKGDFDIYYCPRNGLYEQAVYIPKENVKVFYEMYKAFRLDLDNLQKEDPRQKQHPDQMLQRFVIKNGIKRGNTKISLVEHIGKKSSLGHFIGQATLYIDNL